VTITVFSAGVSMRAVGYTATAEYTGCVRCSKV